MKTGSWLCQAAEEEAAPQLFLREVLQEDPAPREKEFFALMEQAVEEAEEGRWSSLRDKEIRFISMPDALLQSLEKNLSHSVQKYGLQSAEAAIAEARAVFDPVFNVSVGYSDSRTHQRIIRGTLRRKKSDPQPNTVDLRDKACQDSTIDLLIQEGKPLPPVCLGEDNDPQVIKLRWRKVDAAAEDTIDITASESSKNSQGPAPDKIALSLGISQELPWGGAFTLSEMTTYQEIYSDKHGNKYDPDAPWTARMTLGLTVPLPWTRGFGRFSDHKVNIMLRENARDASSWATRASVNRTLLDVEEAFWALVRRYEALAITMEDRSIADRNLERAQRLSRLGRMTRYDQMQVEAEKARSLVDEQKARRQLVLASLSLSDLLESATEEGDDVIYVPALYSRQLVEPLRADVFFKQVQVNGIRYSPELKRQRLALDASEITHASRVLDTKPDLAFNASLSLSQNGSEYGYTNAAKSVTKLLDPDTRSTSLGFQYQRAWGNRANLSRLDQATQGVEIAGIGLEQMENEIWKRVRDGESDLYSADSRESLASEMKQLAEMAYEKLQRKQKLGRGDVTQLEMIVTQRQRMEARLNLLNARIDGRKAEARILAAQGTLPNHRVQKSAFNTFEAHRLNTLAANNVLNYFAPVSD